MPYSAVNGVELFYLSRGKGVPLVLLHGERGRKGSWGENVEVLSRRYRVVRYDRRGTVRSRPKDVPESWQLWIEDLRQLMLALKISPAFICGSSYGGLTVLEFVLAHPQMCRGGIIVSATARGFQPDPGSPYTVSFPKRINDLGKIKVPCLVVQGKKDTYFPPEHGEELARGIRGARLAIVDAGHGLTREVPQEFNKIVLDFMDRVAKAQD